jgi:hypothetical protein
MKKVNVVFDFCGVSFHCVMDVPAEYFLPNGEVDRRKLGNRLSANPTAVIGEVVDGR